MGEDNDMRPLELRIHGIGNHEPWSALGNPRCPKMHGDYAESYPPPHFGRNVHLLNWSRATRRGGKLSFILSAPMTMINVAGHMSCNQAGRASVAVWTASILLSVLMFILVIGLIETASRALEGSLPVTMFCSEEEYFNNSCIVGKRLFDFLMIPVALLFACACFHKAKAEGQIASVLDFLMKPVALLFAYVCFRKAKTEGQKSIAWETLTWLIFPITVIFLWPTPAQYQLPTAASLLFVDQLLLFFEPSDLLIFFSCRTAGVDVGCRLNVMPTAVFICVTVIFFLYAASALRRVFLSVRRHIRTTPPCRPSANIDMSYLLIMTSFMTTTWWVMSFRNGIDHIAAPLYVEPTYYAKFRNVLPFEEDYRYFINDNLIVFSLFWFFLLIILMLFLWVFFCALVDAKSLRLIKISGVLLVILFLVLTFCPTLESERVTLFGIGTALVCFALLRPLRNRRLRALGWHHLSKSLHIWIKFYTFAVFLLFAVGSGWFFLNIHHLYSGDVELTGLILNYIIWGSASIAILVSVGAFRSLRETLGAGADIAGFFPIRYHPLAVNSYRGSVLKAMKEVVANSCDRVVVIGHSQGSVLAAAFTARYYEAGNRPSLGVHLITCGSPLQTLYTTLFPAQFDDAFFGAVKAGSDRWVNFWRETDPIATEVLGAHNEKIDDIGASDGTIRGHSDYWTEEKLLNEASKNPFVSG